MSPIIFPLPSGMARSLPSPKISLALILATFAPAGFAAEPPAGPPAAAVPAASPAKTASAGVFVTVRNLAGDALKGREQAFEDLVASRVSAESGVSVMSRAEAVRRLSAAEGGKAGLEGDKADAAFEDRASALRLAQELDARGILSLSLVSYGKETVSYSGNGITTINDRHTLRVAWKLLDATSAGGLVGDTVSATRTVRQNAGILEVPGDLMNGLLDDAALKVAEGVRARLAADASAATALKAPSAKRVKFSVGVTGRNLFFPELAVDKAGVLSISRQSSPVALDGVTVELDGAAVGTAPFAAPAEARPGLHKMRLSREGFKPWEGVVNLYEGFTFNAALEPDDAGLKRWREQAAFIEGLKAGSKLNDAEVAFIRAKAESLRNYGFKVDFKVDAKELPENKSNVINVIPGVTR